MKNCERLETKLTTVSRSEADGLDSLDSLYVRVEYYRSLEYCLKWERPMHLRRSSRLPKASKKSPERNPSPHEEVTQCRLGGKRTGQRRTKSGSGEVNADERGRDIIDIINSTSNAAHVAKEDEGTFVEIADKGVDESDEDCASVSSSVASGPSLSYHGRLSKGRCAACQKLYHKARRMKAPIKNKLLDNDPKSLTCDQWTLIKKWRPTKMPNPRGKLLIYAQLVKKRHGSTKVVKRHEQCVGESSACSRPHIFLQRNLRRCVKVPVEQEKNKGRKRTREDAQGYRVAKQQRLQSNTRHQHIKSTIDNSRRPASAHSSMNGFEDCSDEEINNPSHKDLTVEVNPSTVTLETTRSTKLSPSWTTPKKTRGFRDLLAQLRSNSSIIVRETR